MGGNDFGKYILQPELEHARQLFRIPVARYAVYLWPSMQDTCDPETEKLKTFRLAVFIAQKLSGRGKGCVNQIFAIKMCGNHNFAPKGWFNSKIICLSIWIPATKLSESLF